MPQSDDDRAQETYYTGRELANQFYKQHSGFLVALSNHIGNLKGDIAKEDRISGRLITLLVTVLNSASHEQLEEEDVSVANRQILEAEAAQIKLAQLNNAPTPKNPRLVQNTRFELIHTEFLNLNDVLQTSSEDKPKLHALADRFESLAARYEFGEYTRREFSHVTTLVGEAQAINRHLDKTFEYGGEEDPKLVVSAASEKLGESTSFTQTRAGGGFLEVLKERKPIWAAKLAEQQTQGLRAA